MSVGRKPKSSQIDSDWERVFYKSVGFYVQSIIIGLQEKSENNLEFSETGQFLLEKIKNFNVKSFPIINRSEIPFDIPKHWAWCRLGEIIEFTTNLNIESKLSADTLIDYVDIDAIDNKKFKIREVKTKPVSALSSRARRVLKKGFVIYSLVRPYLNNLAIITEERNNFIGSTGFAVFNGIFVNNEYLKFLLLTEFIRNRYLELLSGFNSPSITQEQFVNTLVPLPPLVEQEKIVSFLNDLENNSLKSSDCYFDKDVERKIVNLQDFQLKGYEISTELNYQLALVKELRQAYLREAMQGKLVPQDSADEPAEILLEKIKAEKEKLVTEKRIRRDKYLPPINAEEIPFEIPSNWTWCRGEIVADYIDPQPSHRTPPVSKDGVPYIAMSDIKADGRLNFDSARKVSFEVLNEHRERYELKTGDFIFGKIGTIGKPVLLPQPFNYTLSANLILIQPKREIILDKYLFFFLSSPVAEKELKDKKSTTSYPVFGMGKARNMPIPLPPLAEQERIVAKLEKLMKFCDELEANIRQGIKNADQLLQTALKEALEPK